MNWRVSVVIAGPGLFCCVLVVAFANACCGCVKGAFLFLQDRARTANVKKRIVAIINLRNIIRFGFTWYINRLIQQIEDNEKLVDVNKDYQITLKV